MRILFFLASVGLTLIAGAAGVNQPFIGTFPAGQTTLAYTSGSGTETACDLGGGTTTANIYKSGSFGSVSGATVGAATVIGFIRCAQPNVNNAFGVVRVSGFSSDPSVRWFQGANCYQTSTGTYTGGFNPAANSTVNYSYSSGTATWVYLTQGGQMMVDSTCQFRYAFAP